MHRTVTPSMDTRTSAEAGGVATGPEGAGCSSGRLGSFDLAGLRLAARPGERMKNQPITSFEAKSSQPL